MLDRRRTDLARPEPWLLRFVNGVDRLLSGFVGSADIGPYVAPDSDRRLPDIACPNCGQPILAHETRRTAAIGRLYCPEPLSTEPV